MNIKKERKVSILFLLLVLILLSEGIAGKRLEVGPGKTYPLPSLAFAVAGDGDTIDIAAGEYRGDVASVGQNSLNIRGIGGKAHLNAGGKDAEGKAIWVIKGDENLIENIEFSGASVPDQNGAGIRFEGKSLTIRNCYFHDNENGLLVSNNPEAELAIENCEFANNGFGDGLTHNMYIGKIKSFTLKFSYIHHVKIGNNVKSRAENNYILYNRIMDEQTGTASYQIDLPNGGLSFIMGNLIQQGPAAENYHIISYGAEGLSNPVNEVYIVNNTIVNDRSSGVFVRIKEGTESSKIINNIFAGQGQILSGLGDLFTNLVTPDIHKTITFFSEKPGLRNIEKYDYELTKDSPAIDKGSMMGRINNFDPIPRWEYVHPLQGRERVIQGKIDIGAYEFNSK